MLSIWMMSPGFTLGRHVARVAEQRLAMAERADDDVALADLRHAAAGQLERVVGRLVVEHLDDHDHAFLGGDVVGEMRTSCDRPHGLRDRGDLVDHHDVRMPRCTSPLVPFARSPARR